MEEGNLSNHTWHTLERSDGLSGAPDGVAEHDDADVEQQRKQHPDRRLLAHEKDSRASDEAIAEHAYHQIRRRSMDEQAELVLMHHG